MKKRDSRNWDELSIESLGNESLSSLDLPQKNPPTVSKPDDQQQRQRRAIFPAAAVHNERPRRYSASEGVTGFQSFEPKLKLSLEIKEQKDAGFPRTFSPAGRLTTGDRIEPLSPTDAPRFPLLPLGLSSHSRRLISIHHAAAVDMTPPVVATASPTEDDDFLYLSNPSLSEEEYTDDEPSVSVRNAEEEHTPQPNKKTLETKPFSRLETEDDLTRAESFLRRQLTSLRKKSGPPLPHPSSPVNKPTPAFVSSPASVPYGSICRRKENRRLSRWRTVRPERHRQRLNRSNSDSQLFLYRGISPRADSRQFRVMYLRAAAVPVTADVSPTQEVPKQRQKPLRLLNRIWPSGPGSLRRRKHELDDASPLVDLQTDSLTRLAKLDMIAVVEGGDRQDSDAEKEGIRRIETLGPQEEDDEVVTSKLDLGHVEATPLDVLLLSNRWDRHNPTTRLATLIEWQTSSTGTSCASSPTGRVASPISVQGENASFGLMSCDPTPATGTSKSLLSPPVGSPSDVEVPLSPLVTSPSATTTVGPLLSGVQVLPARQQGTEAHQTPESAVQRKNWAVFEQFSDGTPGMSDVESLPAVFDDEGMIMAMSTPELRGTKAIGLRGMTRTPAPLEHQSGSTGSTTSAQKGAWQLHWPFKRKTGKNSSAEKDEDLQHHRRHSASVAGPV